MNSFIALFFTCALMAFDFYSLSIGNIVTSKCIEVVVYEPVLEEEEFYNSKVMNDLEEFKKTSDVIIANRLDDILEDVVDKVYTRDLYQEN